MIIIFKTSQRPFIPLFFYHTNYSSVALHLHSCEITYTVLKYQGLTRDFRREVWKNLLSKAQTIQGPAIVGDDELQLLENFPLNGREVSSHIDSQCSPTNRYQIKNLLSIGYTLATVKKQQVIYKYLEMAAESNEKLSEKFGQGSGVESMYV